MSKLVIIDGHAILHRAYHAMPKLTSKNGEPINAVYGFTSMLLRVIQDLKPTHLAVCFDRPEPTFRKDKFEDYQKQRPDMDEDLVPQIDKANQVVEAFGIPVFSLAGYEADDVIGTIASQAKVDKVVIVTGDKDILQLVDDKVKVYFPVKGLSEAKLMGKEEVIEKLGVEPKLVPDYKALVGDPSDNYPGVPGIGPKTATDLLKKYGSFSKILENIGIIPNKVADKLTSGRTSGLMSYELATIVRHVPVSFNLEKAGSWKVDSKKVLDLFKNFGFRTLSDRVQKVGKELEKEKQMTLV